MGFSAVQVLAGATKLSELGIDIDKNWLTYLIKNLGDPVDAQDAATRAFVLAQIANDIGIHAAISGAHHTKTTAASEITSGRFGMVRMPDMALGKIMLGQGAGVSPIEADSPGLDFPMKLKPAVTRWVIPGWYTHSYSVGSQVANRIYYIPIFVSETTTYIRIGVHVHTGILGTCDLRIYNWSGGLPTSQVLSAGTVSTTTSGAKELVISQALTRGYYFLAFRCTATTSMRSVSTTGTGHAPVPGINLIGGTTGLPGCCMHVDAAFADPAPAPTAIAFAYNVCVFLREN